MCALKIGNVDELLGNGALLVSHVDLAGEVGLGVAGLIFCYSRLLISINFDFFSGSNLSMSSVFLVT